MGYVSKHSNTMTRKKCDTCKNRKIKSDLEPCRSCIELKDGTRFTNYIKLSEINTTAN